MLCVRCWTPSTAWRVSVACEGENKKTPEGKLRFGTSGGGGACTALLSSDHGTWRENLTRALNALSEAVEHHWRRSGGVKEHAR